MTQPRILLIDIETSPNTAYVWGLWGENIPLDRLIETSELLCYSAMWYGGDEIYFDSVNQSSKKELLVGLSNFLSEADFVVHYNGKRFDIPVMNTEFLRANMPPPSPYKQIDLYETVKRKFRFTSNKLEHVLKQLGLALKGKVPFTVWAQCMQKDKNAWKTMEEYNMNDVLVLGKLYTRLLPWISNHPNVGVYTDASVCPACGSDHHQRRGSVVANTLKYQRYTCMSCGKWFRGKDAIKSEKKTEFRNVVGF